MEIQIISFGYKWGDPPFASMVFDVRFLDNPFWIDHLRPLNGRDQGVQDYVLSQPQAKDFLEAFFSLAKIVLPAASKRQVPSFIIAFGCTGGQHRSMSVAEHVAKMLQGIFPDYLIKISHRELLNEDEVESELESESVSKKKSKKTTSGNTELTIGKKIFKP